MSKIKSIGEREARKKRTLKILKIVFTIIGAILVIGLVIGLILGIRYVVDTYTEAEVKPAYSEVLTEDVSFIKELDVEVNAISFIVKHEGNNVSLSHHEFIYAAIDGDEIVIKEKKRKWYERVEGTVVLTVPVGFNFDSINIESGAGKVQIEGMEMRELDLELGAGKVVLDDVSVSGNVDIDGGAGKIEIKSGTYNNMNLEMGIGKLEMQGGLTGSNTIDASVGACDIKLIGSDYKIHSEKGLGDIIIGNYIVSDNTDHGTGNTKINIYGGIGNIVVKFIDEEGKILGDIYENNNL